MAYKSKISTLNILEITLGKKKLNYMIIMYIRNTIYNDEIITIT